MTEPSDERRTDAEQRLSRRHLLAAVGAGATATLAGCGAVLGRSGPRSLNPPDVIEDSPTARAWEFPRGASDEQTPIRAYLDQAYRVPNRNDSAAVRFTFGATVSSDSPYRHDEMTLRLQAPAHYRGDRPPADVFVRPLEGGFTSRIYERDRETVVSLDDLDVAATLQFEFIVDPGGMSIPETLGYGFEVKATNPGLLGNGVVASAAGRFPIVFEQE